MEAAGTFAHFETSIKGKSESNGDSKSTELIWSAKREVLLPKIGPEAYCGLRETAERQGVEHNNGPSVLLLQWRHKNMLGLLDSCMNAGLALK